MTEQDRKEFEAWFQDQPIHPSNTREHQLLRACWLAARRSQDAKVRELVEDVLYAAKHLKQRSLFKNGTKEQDIATEAFVNKFIDAEHVAAQLKEQDDD